MIDDKRSAFNWRDPRIDWENIEHGHLVHLYENEGFLVQTVGVFLSMALRPGEAALVIATEEHRNILEQWLAADGHDMDELQRTGQYVALDAQETLKQLMRGAVPQRGEFFEIFGPLLSTAVHQWSRVSSFSEMAAMLWTDGNHRGAVSLEDLWNQLGKLYPFTMVCAFPKNSTGITDDSEAFSNVCLAHSTIIL